MGQENIISMTSYIKGNDTCGQAVNLSVEDLAVENQVKVFPNPATNEFTIYDVPFAILEIEIYNMLGEKVFSRLQTTNHQPQTYSIDVSSLTPGVYFVRLANEKEQVVRKVIVQR